MKLIIILLSLAALGPSARAAIFTNNPSADSFVRSNAPTLNYGSAGSLSISGTTATNGSGAINGASDSFLRFNMAAMVVNFNSLFGSNNWSISGAKLRVTEQAAPPNGVFNRGIGAFEIRWIANDNWTEGAGSPMTPSGSGINYNTEATLLNSGTDISLGTFTNTGADVTVNFSLALPLGFINDLIAGGEAGLYVRSTEPATGFTFYSRSFTTNSLRPFLEISAMPRPGMAAINFSGTNVVLSATNGVAGGTYFVLSSTNVALSFNQWVSMATNVLNANGNFNVTITNAMTAPQQFFILQAQ